MVNLIDNLQSGDDIQYRSSNTPDSPLHYGRISNVAGVDESEYIVTRFEVYTDPTPSPTFKCLALEELFLTSETVAVTRNNVIGIIFVLSVDAVERDPISLIGMANLFYIRFQMTESLRCPTNNWMSFRPLGLPKMIFFYLITIRDAFIKMINNTKISQHNNATVSLKIPSFMFSYIKLRLHPLTPLDTNGTRVEREFSATVGKSSRRVQIHKEVLAAGNEEELSHVLKLFGRLIRVGTRILR
jgi:hypothetical protein